VGNVNKTGGALQNVLERSNQEPPPTQEELDAAIEELDDMARNLPPFGAHDEYAALEKQRAELFDEIIEMKREAAFTEDDSTRRRCLRDVKIYKREIDDIGKEAKAIRDKEEQQNEKKIKADQFYARYNAAIKQAVRNCWDRAKADGAGNSGDLYATWHQHVGTIVAVSEEFHKILKAQGEIMDHKNPFEIQFQNDYGGRTEGNYTGGRGDETRSVSKK
jgi:hypothetical protein